ncbi:MAG: ABC transporter ATP-binding protein [Oscillospiraceae bacterium]|jgi:ABC-2 type transport system ATP-binding protein|nr:ABC transporter ATP-binding protein [Oscillospiraceae bacterium]
MENQNLVEIKGLTKSYGAKVVLEDISLTLPAGKIIGLMGPNGSGKTSLMKILTGMINDYSGDVRIDGQPVGAHTKAIVAYLPDKSFLPPWMSCQQAIGYFGDFYANFEKEKAFRMLEAFQLDPKQKVKTMSKGMQEKLLLLLVMCRSAQFYVLDEPLGGVDPSARQFIMDTILNNRPQGSTILLSTHMIYDMERVFDVALMIGRKQVLLNDAVANLEAQGKTLDGLFKEVFPYVY